MSILKTKESEMGNRAVIQMVGEQVVIYVHNNGGLDTIQPLLDVAKEYGLRGDDYGMARLTQMLGNLFGGILNIGIDKLENLDKNNYDNGTYVISRNFNIVERLFFDGEEQNYIDYDEMKAHIKAMNDQFFIRDGILA